MNELLFLFQIGLMVLFLLFSLQSGKEALLCLFILCAIMANLFVLKQIALFGMHVTASDSFAIGAILCLNLLQEYFGKESAKKATWISLFALLIFSCFAQLHLLYKPTSADYAQQAYLTLFQPSLRLLFASICTFFLAQRLDLFLFSYLKKWIKPLFLRNAASSSLSQLFDTTLFSFLGLYGLVESISQIIFVSFLIKLLLVLLYSPFLLLAKKVARGVKSAAV